MDLGLSKREASNSSESVKTSGDVPVARISVGSRLKHVSRISNQTGCKTAKARPSGTRGCEVWRKIGDVPAGPHEMEYVDLITRNPFVVEYPMQDAGKQVYYVCRWVRTNGEKGSWSSTESATVAA